MKIALVVLLFVATVSAVWKPQSSITPAENAAIMDQIARSDYEAARKNYRYRSMSLSYDEALAVAPARMEKMARYNYETNRKTYEATRKPHEPRSGSYDEAVAFSRSG